MPKPLPTPATSAPRQVGGGGVTAGTSRRQDDRAGRPPTLGEQRHRPRGRTPLGGQAADEVGEAVGRRAAAARAGPPSRGDHDPATHTAAASERRRRSSIRMLRPTARSAALVEGQAPARPTRTALGGVHARATKPRNRPDDRDHEEADDRAERAPTTRVRGGMPAALSRRPGTTYFTTVPATRSAAATANTVHAVGAAVSRAPRRGRARRTSTVPGSTGTRIPTRPDQR